MFEQVRKVLRATKERAERFGKDPKGVLRRGVRQISGDEQDSRAEKELHAAQRRAERRERKESKLRAAEERAARRQHLKAERREHKKRKLRAAKEQAERRQHEKRKRAQQEADQRADEPEMGALPDFFIIGARKAGTTFLYHLLTLHPYVERALKKETYFFTATFDEGVEWYREYFPAPKWKDGRRTITGEASPLMANHLVPERMAQVIPQARLIALLRNPVDRTYSDYQMMVRKGRKSRSFEEAIGLEGTTLDENSHYLSRSVYVDQLLRWSQFFPRQQMLILKSEDFYERPGQTLKVVLEFLDLPDWEPEASEIIPKKQNKGSYERGMAPETRRRLEEYFEPHNKRLYEYLGVDFGW